MKRNLIKAVVNAMTASVVFGAGWMAFAKANQETQSGCHMIGMVHEKC